MLGDAVTQTELIGVVAVCVGGIVKVRRIGELNYSKSFTAASNRFASEAAGVITNKVWRINTLSMLSRGGLVKFPIGQIRILKHGGRTLYNFNFDVVALSYIFGEQACLA